MQYNRELDCIMTTFKRCNFKVALDAETLTYKRIQGFSWHVGCICNLINYQAKRLLVLVFLVYDGLQKHSSARCSLREEAVRSQNHMYISYIELECKLCLS